MNAAAIEFHSIIVSFTQSYTQLQLMYYEEKEPMFNQMLLHNSTKKPYSFWWFAFNCLILKQVHWSSYPIYKFYGFWRWIKFPKYIYVTDWNNCNELIQMHLAASIASTLHMLYYLFQIFNFNCNLQSVFFSVQNGHESSTMCFVQLATKPYQNMQNLEFQVNGLPASQS